jgi:pimeloyl-ACP methyl ester carboxylesterase
MSSALKGLEPLRHTHAGPLDVAYFEAGPLDGEVTPLLHGYPYDIHSYVDVIPRLVTAGQRVIVPYLRGHGPARFLDADTPRSREQAAIGSDVIALLDALDIPRAIFAGYDWTTC